ncbi:MAG: cell division protein FtsZ [Oscillospiraceae bacterium]|nr:cell division protein FtsZ [Oscillospiraceae bacterium]MCI6025917.1 cell division protein FtsZ [Oscillospiraceae bacterium]MCM0706916.1 cell division protein FtsZ [Faecalicatena sp. BF-R-105]MDY3219876.1 cell division protein FtsZ [Candidatus Fimivivens sp.]
MNFDMVPEHQQATVIKVVGVGGGGGNAINRMVLSGMKNVEFISMNTDYQALATSHATYTLNIGARLTKGKGAGGQADIGQRSAEESREEIAKLLKGTDMVFITAGMGGGTGTGAAPVIAEIAKDMGILTVGVVTKPFKFEGRRRMEHAEMGITAMREHVDALIVIPNERLQQISTEKITLANAFAAADEVLRQGVQSIVELIGTTGVINLDFADVTSIMKDAGNAHMGVGRASGKDKARLAAEAAINSPLLETSINGAKGVIVNITVPPDIALEDVYSASELITDAAHPDVNLIWGVAYDENLKDELVLTVIATSFDGEDEFAIPSYIQDIANYTPKSDPATPVLPGKEQQARPAAPAVPAAQAQQQTGYVPAPEVQPAPAPAPAAPEPEGEAEEDPYDVIMKIFGKNKR